MMFQTLLHTLVGIGLAGLIGKLHKWDESAIFFDGSSLGPSRYLAYFSLFTYHGFGN